MVRNSTKSACDWTSKNRQYSIIHILSNASFVGAESSQSEHLRRTAVFQQQQLPQRSRLVSHILSTSGTVRVNFTVSQKVKNKYLLINDYYPWLVSSECNKPFFDLYYGVAKDKPKKSGFFSKITIMPMRWTRNAG